MAFIGNLPRRDEDVHSLFEPSPSFCGAPGHEGSSTWSIVSDESSTIPTTSTATEVGIDCDNRNALDVFGLEPPTPIRAVASSPGCYSPNGIQATVEQELCCDLQSISLPPGTIIVPPSLATIYFSISVGSGMSRSKRCLPSAYHIQALVRNMAQRCSVQVSDSALSSNGDSLVKRAMIRLV